MSLSFHDQQHINRLLVQEQSVNQLFNGFINSVSPDLKRWNDSGRNNVWIRNAGIENTVDRRLLEFQSEFERLVKNYSLDSWNGSTAKNDLFVNEYIKDLAVNNLTKKGMFSRNLDALQSFQNRVENGLSLSGRVSNITSQTKDQLEYYLKSGVGTGRSAATISQDIRQLMKEPDKRFRRIRDLKGNLVESQPMKNYHPGQGVYKSSYKNAVRIASTETNMAYRLADSERWKQLDFVLGFEVKRSRNHQPCAVCDALVGKYPKDFVFPGWHPFCICMATPIVMEHDNFADYLLNKYSKANKRTVIDNSIKDIPAGAIEFFKNNENLVEKSYFGKQNTDFVKQYSIFQGKINQLPEKQIANQLSDLESNILQVESKIGIKKDAEMTFEEANELKGNVNYLAGIEYRINCQSCVVSNELRRRGFNVTALKNTKTSDSIPYKLSKKTELAWIDTTTNTYPIKSVAGKGTRSIGKLSKELADLMPDVGRYNIDFVWKGTRSGHIITVERLENGKFRFYDPQNGKIVQWTDLVHKISLKYGVSVLRVDNKLINTDLIAGIVAKL